MTMNLQSMHSSGCRISIMSSIVTIDMQGITVSTLVVLCIGSGSSSKIISSIVTMYLQGIHAVPSGCENAGVVNGEVEGGG